MLINFNHLKTFYSALTQKMKDFRGNWNQNDSTAEDYIKNRPFYSEKLTDVVLPKYTLSSKLCENSENFCSTPLIEGREYKVIFNGTEYACLARNDGYGGICIGNLALALPETIESTNEPFMISTMTYENDFVESYFLCILSDAYDLSISSNGEIVYEGSPEMYAGDAEEVSAVNIYPEKYLIEGKTYKVIFNGIEYICLARNDGYEYIYIGNQEIVADLELPDTVKSNEPFFIFTYVDGNYARAMLFTNLSGLQTCEIYIEDEIVHKLDPKYLPDDIGVPDNVATTDDVYDIMNNNLAPVAFTNNYDSLSGKPTIYTDVVRYNIGQSLNSSQKLIAKNNIQAVGYDVQSLTDAQKLQARSNIGASDFSGDYFDLENKPCTKTILADEVILVDHTVPFDEYVYGRSLGSAPLKPTSDYKYRVIIGESTYYPSVTEYSSGSALGNKSLMGSAYEDSGEPFFFTFLPNSTHTFNVAIYYDKNVLNTPANVQVIQEMKVEYSLLEDGYIPDTIARKTDVREEISQLSPETILHESDVKNDLKSTATNKPLSAAQGVVLNDKINNLQIDLNNINTELTALSNCSAIASKVYITDWTLGRLQTTGIASSTYRAYSNRLPADNETLYYFDDTKYKLCFCGYKNPDDANISGTSSWFETSPALNPLSPNTYSKVSLQLQALDTSMKINVVTDIEVYFLQSTDSATSVLVDKVLTNETNIDKLLSNSAIDKIVYVSTSGSDDNDGSKESPYRTIQKAIDKDAEIIKVFSGEYSPVTISNKDHPIVIMLADNPTYSASPEEQDLPKIKITNADSYTGISASNCTELYMYDIWCDNVARSPFYLKDCGYVECFRCYASNNSVDNFGGFRIVNCNGVFRDCKAWNITLDGFNIHGYGNTEFINCMAFDCGDDGISHHDSCTGLIIGGEFYNNGKGGISSPYGGAKIDIYNAYSHNNTKYGLYADSDSTHPSIYARVSNCVFKNNGTSDIYVADGTVIGWHNVYDTINVKETATYTNYTAIESEQFATKEYVDSKLQIQSADETVSLQKDILFYEAKVPKKGLDIEGTFSNIPYGWVAYLTILGNGNDSVSSTILETTSINGFTLSEFDVSESFTMAIFKHRGKTKLQWYLFKSLSSAEEARF